MRKLQKFNKANYDAMAFFKLTQCFKKVFHSLLETVSLINSKVIAFAHATDVVFDKSKNIKCMRKCLFSFDNFSLAEF